jgi:hypothetical protein
MKQGMLAASGSWLSRVAARYKISVAMLCETSISGELPAPGTAGWILLVLSR